MGLFEWARGLKESYLYYPGCFLEPNSEKIAENYKEIFRILRINFFLLDEDKSCCGLRLLNQGYEKEARKIARTNFELFKQNNVKKIISNCPYCCYAFKEVYPKFIPEWDLKTLHVSEVILERLKIKKINFEVPFSEEKVTYYDPCYLSRHLGIYNEPRMIIKRLGGTLIEMKHNKEKSICCGGIDVKNNFPEFSKSFSEMIVKEIPKESEKLICSCNFCYNNLKKGFNSVEDFSSFVLRKLKENL